jgi:hypothetical protein
VLVTSVVVIVLMVVVRVPFTGMGRAHPGGPRVEAIQRPLRLA